MRTLLLGLLLSPALWSQGNEWTVRYIGGPYRAADRQRIALRLEPGVLLLNDEVAIPVAAVTGVAYQRVSSRRSGTWVEAGDFVDGLALCLLLTNELIELRPAYRHHIHVVWYDAGGLKRLIIEASKGDYRPILAALKQATGRPWNGYQHSLPDRHIRSEIVLDVAAKEAALQGVQARLRRTGPVPAHLASFK